MTSSDVRRPSGARVLPETGTAVANGRWATDVISHGTVELIASDAVVLSSTTTITGSLTSARVGDVLWITSGALAKTQVSVIEVAGATLTLGQTLPDAPAGGVTYDILRFRPALLSSTGAPTVDTELSAATLLADGDAIPTAGKVGAVMMAKNTSGTLDIAKLAKAHDVDSGGGTEYATGVSIRKSGSGGSVAMFESAANAGFVNLASSLVPAAYDYISLGYTGSDLTTVVYKTGGSGGTPVATLTLAYTGSRLDSVTKS